MCDANVLRSCPCQHWVVGLLAGGLERVLRLKATQHQGSALGGGGEVAEQQRSWNKTQTKHLNKCEPLIELRMGMKYVGRALAG